MKKITTKLKITISAIALVLFCSVLFLGKNISYFIFQGINIGSAKAYVLPLKNREMVYVKLVFKNAGVLHDDIELHGISNLVSVLLFKKINGLSTEETAEKIIDLGIRELNIDSSADDFKISFFVRYNRIKEAFAFFNKAFVAPSFSDGDLETAKELIPSAMDPETTSPGQLMMQKVFEMLYGDCNYGMNPAGTSKAISSVSKVDIQAFIKRKLTCKNLKIFFVGDISKSDIKNYSKILLVNVTDGDVNTPVEIGQGSSNEPSATITKENMKDVIGIAYGIRIDQLSDVERAALRIIITAIFEGNNSDFSDGLVKSDIACKTHVKLVDRSLSTSVLLCSYIDKKDFDNYMKYVNSKIAEYNSSIDYEKLNKVQEYFIKIANNGFYNVSDIDEQMKYTYMPFDKVTQEHFLTIIKHLFNRNNMKTVICSATSM